MRRCPKKRSNSLLEHKITLIHMNESRHLHKWVMLHLPCVAESCRVLQCVAVVCCSVLQCVAVCCSVLQCESRYIYSFEEIHHHVNDSSHTFKWVTSHKWITEHIWMSHITHTGARMLNIVWMSHDTHMNESRHTCKWVTSHIQVRRYSLSREWVESCHTRQWVTSHIWMSHVTHMNESRHTYEWVTSHIW